jgi:3D (Asp-Asp-Asp) domain-containing protein
MTTILATRRIPDRLVAEFLRMCKETTPRQVIVALILVAAVSTPMTLYLLERGRNMRQERAYRALIMSSASETEFLRTSIRDLLDEQTRLAEVLLDEGYAIESGDHIKVKVVATGYSSSVFETDDTPFITAANTRTRRGILALSRDLLANFNPDAPFSFGDVVHVSGLGEFLVEDTMHPRWTNRIDLWFASREEALRFGIRDVYLSTSVRAAESLEGKSFSEAASTTASASGL